MTDLLERWQTSMLRGANGLARPAITVAAVALSTALRQGLHTSLGVSLVYASHYLAVLVVALFCGARYGLVAIALCLLAANYVVLPPAGLGAPSMQDVSNALFFIIVCLCIVWTAHVERSLLVRVLKKRETLELLMRELQHRNKNHLAIVQAIVSLSLRDEREKATQIAERLNTLGAADDLLTRSPEHTIALAEVVSTSVKLFEHAVRIDGEPVLLEPATARVIALVLHELCTNAAKYGSLSAEGGAVAVTWSKRGNELTLTWTETGGPAPKPGSGGFGLAFISTLLRSVNGRVTTDFTPAGVIHAVALGL